MERKLVLIRHAKSDWANPLQGDFDRPLNERGNRDAPVMGERLKNLHTIPDLIIASPAKRAASTARLIAKETGYDAGNILWVDKLYHCLPHIFEDVLIETGIADNIKTVFIVAHNPGITGFINDTLPRFSLDNLPTCGLVGIKFDAEHWSDYPAAPHSLLFYDYPKNK
jgi:phosphohistidine phosphatase